MRISAPVRALTLAATTTTLLGTTLLGAAQAGPHHPVHKAGQALLGAPTVGACTTLTPEQGAAPVDKSTVVPCQQKHTARVAGVVKLPSGVDFPASDRALFKVVAARCAPKVWAMLGRNHATRDSSAYDYYWFEPTKADRQQGARWLSCSIVVDGGKNLVPLPNNRTPALPKGALGDDVKRCLTVEGFNTTCARTHAWRATGTFSMKVATRPTKKSLNATATRRCVPHVDPQKRYAWTYRDKDTWAAGDRVIVCYTKNKH